ncbi:MAG: hypothetical protein KDJ69_00805 [Nitratireductor sp.]|nr:hypothetical protein [Nitratireductor sp.]
MQTEFRFAASIRTVTLALVLQAIGSVMAINGAFGQEADRPWEEPVLAPSQESPVPSGGLDAGRLERLVKRGETLFAARFTRSDGAGRPMATQAIIPTKRRRPPKDEFQRMAGMDANGCISCHNVPAAGGAGDFTANVFVSEGFGNAEFDSIDPQFSNERNTNHLFGAGLIELLAREMTADLQAIRSDAAAAARKQHQTITLPLETKGVSFGSITVKADGMVDLSGLDGVDTDLVVRPFSQKGVITSLRQFTINALNSHHGIQASERFGERWTGQADFDEDGMVDEAGPADISALVAWQATLQPPIIAEPESTAWREAAAAGNAHFSDIGCARCHIPTLPLNSLTFSDPGPLDAAGTLRAGENATPAAYDFSGQEWAKTLQRNEAGAILVPLFGDLKRHRISDQKHSRLGNELLAQRFVERDVFMTAELWGIGSTAPYGHRGDLTSLDEVIRAHGGDASPSARAYEQLPDDARSAIIAFLKTLVIAP